MTQENTSSTMPLEEPEWQRLYLSNSKRNFARHTIHIENPNYSEHTKLSTEPENPKVMRPWQKEAFEILKDCENCIIQAFCGSGKTLLHVWLGIYDVIASGWKRKQLIVVPQNHIHKGFVSSNGSSYISVKYEDEIYEWMVTNNFCDIKTSSVSGLRNFLLSDVDTLAPKEKDNIIRGLNAIATHQAIARCWSSMSEEERVRASKNLTIRIDECHHVSGVFHSDDLKENGIHDDSYIKEVSTQLGIVCHDILNKGENSRVHMTTATFYRGDSNVILSSEYVKKFKIYSLSLLDQWDSLGLKEFSYGYCIYRGNPLIKLIKNISSEPKEKHIIIVPRKGSAPRTDTMVDEIIRELSPLFGENRILDLVTPSRQARNKLTLTSNPDTFDVVVSCSLFNEGTDWVPASRIHNLHMENSITLTVQRLGRIFRMHPNKIGIAIINYCHEFMSMDKSNARVVLSDRFNAVATAMFVEELFHPILLPTISSDSNNVSPCSYKSLQSFFDGNYHDAVKFMIDRFEMSDKTADSIEAIIAFTIRKFIPGCSDKRNVEDGLKVKLLKMVRPDLRLKKIDVSFIREKGFDKIWGEEQINGSIYFGTNTPLNRKDFKLLQDIIRDYSDYIIRDYSMSKNNKHSPLAGDSYRDYERVGILSSGKYILAEYLRFKNYLTNRSDLPNKCCINLFEILLQENEMGKDLKDLKTDEIHKVVDCYFLYLQKRDLGVCAALRIMSALEAFFKFTSNNDDERMHSAFESNFSRLEKKEFSAAYRYARMKVFLLEKSEYTRTGPIVYIERCPYSGTIYNALCSERIDFTKEILFNKEQPYRSTRADSFVDIMPNRTSTIKSINVTAPYHMMNISSGEVFTTRAELIIPVEWIQIFGIRNIDDAKYDWNDTLNDRYSQNHRDIYDDDLSMLYTHLRHNALVKDFDEFSGIASRSTLKLSEISETEKNLPVSEFVELLKERFYHPENKR